MTDLLRLCLAWGLVWLLGAGVLRRGLRSASHPAWIAGAGFLVGGFLLVLEMTLISRSGLRFGSGTIGAPLALAALALWLPELRRAPEAPHGLVLRLRGYAASARTSTGIAFALLLAWLAVHALLLLGEVLRRPLYPWDAWTQWATKAKVWFALGHMVPFVDASTWLARTSDAYVDAAPHYPALVPLWQVWSNVALGRYDDALMNLPWWLLGVALALALYGFLRARGFSALVALACTWLIVSMPILETHVALAGYADLPLSAYLTCAALSGLLALSLRSRPHAYVALLLALAMPMIKNPGWVWLATLVPGIIVAALPRQGMRVAAAGWGLAVLLVLALSRFDATILNYHLHLNLEVPWQGLVDAYLSYANWHLLFWLLPGVLLVGWRVLDVRGIAPLTAVIVSGALFLLLGFSLTNAFVWVEDQSTVNRATLHLAPLIAVWMLLVMQAVLVRPPSAVAIAPAEADATPAPAPGEASGIASGVVSGIASGSAPVTPPGTASAVAAHAAPGSASG